MRRAACVVVSFTTVPPATEATDWRINAVAGGHVHIRPLQAAHVATSRARCHERSQQRGVVRVRLFSSPQEDAGVGDRRWLDLPRLGGASVATRSQRG
jgi:hypothetical protein